MNKKDFLQSEIKHLIESLNFFKEEDKAQYIEAIDKMKEEELENLLKILYKLEQDYFELLKKDTQTMDSISDKLNTAHDK
jgi:hypothetical protein